MKKMINLKKLDFYYWVNELPELKMNSISQRILEIKRVNGKHKEPVKVALELSLHRHISSYALLGFTYTPVNNSQSLIVRMNCFNEDRTNYLSQIRTGESRKYISSGLDNYLIEVILDEIIDFSKERYFPAGDLNFNVAANCEISSSPQIFKMITKILLNVFIVLDSEKMSGSSHMEKLFMDEILNEVTTFQIMQRNKIEAMIKRQ